MGIPCTVKELKKKRESLMSAYRGYKCKIKKSEKLGAVYRPTWFAYKFMDGFLNTIYQYNGVRNNQGEQNNHQIKIEVSDTDVTNTGETSRNEYISSQQTPTSTIHKDNQDNSDELQRVKNQMDQTLKILETVFQNRNDEYDECNIFGKLVAIKLRKLPEDRRDIMMFKINELLYGESQSYKRPRPPSSSGP
ncbi:uncharacterized protein LOC113237129 [Hyposmocoma kahamanoa]|uniref:uncharacterized protein LOC113237129 n=1 Tax=Hyposmocoma kahamanoa TaxID=1477025 RepID=UPI000E6D65AE|nr:uncharacterized protein LOC113237129 [Hyposmocoma kahamanoa]